MGDLSNLDVSWRSAVLFGFFMPLAFAVVTLATRNVERRANRYLAALLTVFALNLVPQIIGFSGAYQVWPELTFAPFNNELWFGPLLLAHVVSLTSNQPLGRLKWLFLPGVVQTAYYLTVFLSFENYQAKWAYNDAFHEPYVLPMETFFTVTLSVFCLWCCILQIRRYQTFLDDTRSYIEEFDPNWLSTFVYFISAATIFWLGFELTHRFVAELSYPDQYPIHLLLCLIMAIFAMQGVSRIRVGYPKMSDDDVVQQTSRVTTPVVADAEDPWRSLADQLEKRLDVDQWYLQSKLTIADVAREMATNEQYVSRALNQVLGTNFNLFINRARVKHAQQMMDDATPLSMLDIAFASGFNSKASFNRLFKDISGLTPSAYKNLGSQETEPSQSDYF